MKIRYILSTLLALLFGLGALTAHAGGKKKELVKKIQMYRKVMIAEELGLDEETTRRLFPILDYYAEEMRTRRKAQRKLRREIFAEAEKAEPDEEKLEKLLDKLTEQEMEFQSLRVESFQATKGILNAEQRAALLKLLPDLDRRIKKLIAAAKKK